ncbi:dTDP-4-dehydrorhamnose 3,5-epimerase [Paralimibaculum aggregatum]|uniref:dTDP-4-dehydrorhamnose 3,5-epimerase n=1 Tax=Paralimibaculum aggregatum TaxID=3036245 RepID=A0ABQ6LCK5_9RHOB|nr:dTDP-4-dehydrorhamnose 3,5-epimerase [Limibaculum sp. NKW23]GMG81091.1 dTDP-4-dehydrorhamnose 3,5-epimerase [Limibaculum sp. NKW23]
MFEPTDIPDLTIFRPKRHGDARGFFSEVWSRAAFEAAGLAFDWVQDNHSRSAEAGTLRGLHYQAPPMAQAKLVRCTAGRIWDVAVDVRPGSPTHGRHFGIELSAENWAQLLVPRGFLHGFVTLTPDAEVQYKVDAPYSPEHDGAVAWDDPALAIPWPLDGAPVLSAKDAAAPKLADWSNPFGDMP